MDGGTLTTCLDPTRIMFWRFLPHEHAEQLVILTCLSLLPPLCAQRQGW